MHKPVKESALAHKYLDGLKGIEIGGASYNAFGLDTINVDIKADTLSSSKSAQYGVEPMPIDVISPGEDLPIVEIQDTDDKVGNGFTVVIKLD